MRWENRVGVGLLSLACITGCRTATRVSEQPRVDLALEGGGNRGYLVGAPPPAAAQKVTRQMVQTDVEIPSFYKPTTGDKKILKNIAPPEVDMSDESGTGTPAAPGSFGTYVVKKDESLWSIAAKKEIYGKATQWRRIYDANRDILKSPDQIRAGMVLKIPRDGEAKSKRAANRGDEGTRFKK